MNEERFFPSYVSRFSLPFTFSLLFLLHLVFLLMFSLFSLSFFFLPSFSIIYLNRYKFPVTKVYMFYKMKQRKNRIIFSFDFFSMSWYKDLLCEMIYQSLLLRQRKLERLCKNSRFIKYYAIRDVTKVP